MTPRYDGLAHAHGDLRDVLAAFATALGHPAPPPVGHALHDALARAARYFGHELPHHVAEEEAELYPALARRVRPGALGTLREQHAALLVMAPMYDRAYAAFVEAPSVDAWHGLRHIGARLAAALAAHLDLEDALIKA